MNPQDFLHKMVMMDNANRPSEHLFAVLSEPFRTRQKLKDAYRKPEPFFYGIFVDVDV